MEMLIGIVAILLVLVLFVKSRSTDVTLQRLNERLQTLEEEIRKSPDATAQETVVEPRIAPPPITTQILRPQVDASPEQIKTAAVNWEKFMGVNLFAWFGGFALFLAAAFFVKYSIDKNLISPQIRIIIGAIAGIALISLGLRLQKRS